MNFYYNLLLSKVDRLRLLSALPLRFAFRRCEINATAPLAVCTKEKKMRIFFEGIPKADILRTF